MIDDGVVGAKPWHCSLIRLCMPGMLGKSSDHEQNWGFQPVLNFSKKIFSPPLPISFQKRSYAGFVLIFSFNEKYTMRYSLLKCKVVEFSTAHAVQCSAVQCSAVKCSVVQCSSEPYSWEDLHNPAGCLKSRQKKCILYCELNSEL